MKNKRIIVVSVLIVVIVVSVSLVVFNLVKKNNAEKLEKRDKQSVSSEDSKKSDNQDVDGENTSENIKQSKGITVVPTLLDKITSDSAWCGTMQLVWNDMKNDVVKQDVVFSPQEIMAENLNKGEFTEDMISEDYYFKIYGPKTLKLKEQIEKGIKDKFNQESDIIDDFDWSDKELDHSDGKNIERYFFYVMLYRKFEFLTKFDKLENGNFGKKYKNIKYFGISANTEELVSEQIRVLYYNSEKDFAIVINTKDNDEVIFCKEPQGTTFREIYTNMNKKEKSYTGSKKLAERDEFKAPYIEFNQKKEYTELQNKIFPMKEPIGSTGEIKKALQTIKFKLDEKGGEVKSEAAIDMVRDMAMVEEEASKKFYVDDTFVLFLREKGKELPYFAARIDDITKYQ